MSFIDCINASGLTKGQKEKLVQEFQDLKNTYTGTLGDETAAAAAAEKLVSVTMDVMRKKSENVIRDALAWDRVQKKIDGAAAALDAQKGRAGAGAFLFGSNSKTAASRMLLEDVYTRQRAIERRATIAVAEQVEKYRSKAAGLKQDAAGFIDVVRAMLGEKVESASAMNDGAAFREVFDSLHRQYSAEGGILGKIENYFPQVHDTGLVRRAGFDGWREFILPLLDRDKMVDPATALPLTDAKLEGALREAYSGISTNGLDEGAARAVDGKVNFGKGGGMALKRSTSRFLHFKDADSFITYNRKFGHGDSGLFNAALHHIGGMTRDIAIMQAMGPNPGAMMDRISMKVRGDGATPQGIQLLDGMFDTVAGRNSYNGELPLWYRALRGLQDNMRASYLGFAPVSALSDSFFASYAARLNGLSATSTMGRYFSLLNPLNEADRRIARRTAMVSSVASGNSFAHARFLDDAGGHGILGWMAGFTNRASGLSTMTDVIQQAPVMESMGFMAEAKAGNMTWAEVPPAMKDAFKRWDMGEKEFSEIMAAVPHDHDGADFLRPEDVALAGHHETATKYEMWLANMAQDASNEPRLITRAITSGAAFGDARPGTANRAFWSSLTMFKSYGITVILNHLMPALQHAATARGVDRLSMIAPLIIGTTVLGAASMQARQVLQGKTPRSMTEGRFWASAAAQGGGFGIFGDFLFSDYSRFGNGLLATMEGPVIGFADDAARVLKGNFDRTLDNGEDPKFMADVFQLASRNIPMIKLWYTRLLIERLVLDHAQRAVDPNFDNRMRRIEQKMHKEYGQDYWWRPAGG